MSRKTEGNALHFNMNVDYVIDYRFLDTDKPKAQGGLEKLIQALARVGLNVEVRNGGNCSLLVFVKANNDHRFNNHVYRSRVNDWLHGIRAAEPDREALESLTSDPLTDAERLRLVHHIITAPASEGGAAITPKTGEWNNVESIFPLHDHTFNRAWIKKWSVKTFLKVEDLDEIRSKFGEKIAFYFAFTQSYFAFLLFPATFGFSAWALLGSFSSVYAIVNVLWCVVFVEYWKKQEIDLGVRWGVKGVARIQEKRPEFEAENEVQDPVTGETQRVFPATKRLVRQLLIIPFAVLSALALGSLIATCFGIEIFLSEIYDGPGKGVLIFLPTILLITFNPIITGLLTKVATQLNDFENYETTDAYVNAMTQKLFVLNFITSYMGIFLTAFVYVPFGSMIAPRLDIFNLTARPFAQNEKQVTAPKSRFEINPSRLRKQVIYFTVTAQIINFLTEVVLPYIKRRGSNKIAEIKTERAAKRGGAAPSASLNDVPEEVDFLVRVRNEAELAVYDVTDDLREMVIQFGYLSLFSVVWPLVPLSFIINNWIELRSDAVKICIEMRRPIPYRADSIGPWLDSLSFISWLGSITTAALVYLFSNDGLGPDGTPTTIKGWALLLTIFFSEHIYLVVRLGVRVAISKLESPGIAKERTERYMVRKRYLQETFGEDALELPPSSRSEQITRKSLEGEAREASLRTSTPSDQFWSRQKGWEEAVKIGINLIERMAPNEGRKSR